MSTVVIIDKNKKPTEKGKKCESAVIKILERKNKDLFDFKNVFIPCIQL
jgi:hypothetical protein